jgi:ubiquitin-protein ligase
VLVRSRRWRRYHDEQLERHHHWAWSCMFLSSSCSVLIHVDEQTVHENRIYSLKITCGESYPDVPPTVQFLSRVNLPFVNQTYGTVDQSKLPVLANWTRNYSIENVLVEIRKYARSHHLLLTLNVSHREMASFNNRKLPQPPEGSTF